MVDRSAQPLQFQNLTETVIQLVDGWLSGRIKI
jgi:hypothetical protein